MVTKQQYDEAVKVVCEYHEQLKEELRAVENTRKSIVTQITPATSLYEIEKLSVRLSSAMYSMFYGRSHRSITLKMISEKISESDLREWRGVGDHTRKELIDILGKAGLKLKKL